MSTPLDVPELATQILSLPGRLSANVPVMLRKKGEPANNIEARIKKQQICVYVMPMFPTEALQGASQLFFSKGELRVRIFETVKVNKYPVNAFDLIDDVALALHWQPDNVLIPAIKAKMAELNCSQDEAKALLIKDPVLKPYWELGAMLRHPLQINTRPVESIEDPQNRIVDVVFNATYELAS